MVNAYAGRIPDWNQDGVIPPRDPNDPASFNRSPYRASLVDVITRFGSSPVRRELLSGSLDFRAELHRAGLTEGFQWIDGSFVEDVERTRGRAPWDIDVVTFFYAPHGRTDESVYYASPGVFDNALIKETYKIDSYLVPLSRANLEIAIELAAYWYSLWSHTREEKWKGYLQISLDPGDDEAARTMLDRMSGESGGAR